MERSNARIPTPREDQLLDTSSTDQLIVEKVWSEPNRGEVLLPLTDDLLSSSERNEMSETFKSHCVAVVEIGRDRGLKSHEFAHQYSNTAVDSSGLFSNPHYSK